MVDGADWPKISIVTPSYNQGQYIEANIRSVLLQNYPNLEYIVMDGGSSDNTIEILEKYESWISYWISEPDDGQSNAINKGMHRSEGDILYWLNSDDLLKPGALRIVAQKLRLDEAAWLIGAAEVTNSRGKKKYIKHLTDNLTKNTFSHWNLDWIPQQSTFWNRKIFEKCGPVDETLHYAMDVDFLYRLFSIANPVVCSDILACYRIHNHAKTQDMGDESIHETAQWIVQNLLLAPDCSHDDIIEYVSRTIVLHKKINRVRHHLVLGRIISFWKKYININLSL